MRRIISHRPTTIVSSFCAAVDGGRATVAATFPTAGDGGFLPTDPKPNVRTPHADIFGVFVGQSGWAVTARKQLKNEERARKALGLLFRNYGGRATQYDEELDVEKVAKTNTRKLSEEELDAFLTHLAVECETDHEKYEIVRKKIHKVIEKIAKDDAFTAKSMIECEPKTNLRKFSEEELDVFLTNLAVECGTDHEKYEFVRKEFHKVIEKMTQDDEVGDVTRNDRVDKLAEISEEKLDAFVTNSLAAKLMIECEPKYFKRFHEISEKVRKKMIQDDGILQTFELVTTLMSRCDPDYEKLLCEVLEKVRENIRKLDIQKLKEEGSFEEAIVTEAFQSNLADVKQMKPYFMAYEVIENVAKKVGNENLRKIAKKEQDAIITNSFAYQTVVVQMSIPLYKYSKHVRSVKVAKTNICKLSEEELDAFLTNLAIECGTDFEKYENVRKVIDVMTKDDESDDEFGDATQNDRVDELGDATQNDRVDKLAEIAAEDKLDAFLTHSFTAKLMIECEPKYEKRFREIIEKVRKKMIQDDRILQAFELVTDFMKCEPEYEKLLCEVLEKVREKITQEWGNENTSKIEKLAKLDMKVGDKYNFEEELDKFGTRKFLNKLTKLDMKAGRFEKTMDEYVTKAFLTNLRRVEIMKPHFMACEVIEKVAKKAGNENLRKIAEKKLDALVTNSFVSETAGVRMNIPHFMYVGLVRS